MAHLLVRVHCLPSPCLQRAIQPRNELEATEGGALAAPRHHRLHAGRRGAVPWTPQPPQQPLSGAGPERGTAAKSPIEMGAEAMPLALKIKSFKTRGVKSADRDRSVSPRPARRSPTIASATANGGGARAASLRETRPRLSAARASREGISFGVHCGLRRLHPGHVVLRRVRRLVPRGGGDGGGGGEGGGGARGGVYQLRQGGDRDQRCATTTVTPPQPIAPHSAQRSSLRRCPRSVGGGWPRCPAPPRHRHRDDRENYPRPAAASPLSAVAATAAAASASHPLHSSLAASSILTFHRAQPRHHHPHLT